MMRTNRRQGRRPIRFAGLMVLACAALTAGSGPQAVQEPNRGGTVDLASEDPRVALERLKVADGYVVNLFASEQEFPDLAKPLAMTFDTRGRLWVLTSPTYPHVLPGEQPNDKLIVLEDTNGDGKADKSTVFADRLYIPTGFELGDGGAYVSQQPNLMFLRDTNGDGKADERRIILHGFGTEDSHHSIHAYTWGPDGALYFQEGTFLHSQVETPYGPQRLAYAGVWRYEPRTEKLNVFVSYPFANPWGHVVDRWGQNFVSDASNGANYYGTAFSGHLDYPVKHRSMQEWTLTRVRPTSGIEFIRSRHFPESAQGNFLFNNTIGFQGIKQYKVTEEGSGFVAVETEPLLQSTDPNFRPVGLQFGPDGALYVIDWFNPLIGHMQYSIRDPRRDKQHGRVWRITARGRPLNQRPLIHGQPIDAQLELLKAYEDRTRYRARLALRDRPTEEVAGAVRRWVAGLDATDANYEHHLLEALWVLQHHDIVETPLLTKLLGAKEFRARAAAVRVLQLQFDRVDGAMAHLRKLVDDPAPRVRLEVVRALSFQRSVEAAELAVGVLRHPMDYYLRYVLDETLTALEPQWKPALTSGKPLSSTDPAGLAFLLDRLSPTELAALPPSDPVQRALVSRAGVSAAHRKTAIDALARAGGRSSAAELVATIGRLDGTPGTGSATLDLAKLLVAEDATALAATRPALEQLAGQGRIEAARQGGFAGLLRADGSIDRAWTFASGSPRRQVDLLASTALLDRADVLASMHARIVSVLDASSARPQETPVTGRYVRIVLPGRDRTLSLAEVQVFAGSENIAPKGTATQSSIVAGGAIGGHAPRANDGKLDADSERSSDPAAGSVSFTAQEQDPWWELDLGSARPIETIAVWNGNTGGRNDTLHVSVLDADRRPVFVAEGLRTSTPTETVTLGGDFTSKLQNTAITALPAVPGHDAESVSILGRFVKAGPTRQAAIAALQRIPKSAWPREQLAPLATDLVAYLRALPAADRSGAAFGQALQLARDISGELPQTEGARITSALDALAVRTVRIEAVQAQMKFSISRFTVEAGQEVEIVFVNTDEMPHNLLITAQGAMEVVSLKAEAMMKEADAFAKHFVPKTPEVLFATKLLNPGETARLRFTAPKETGSYPFVCTFPGHWRTMNGNMDVVRPTVTSTGQ
jgi:glucose/arabinose dehydrogenase/azurin